MLISCKQSILLVFFNLIIVNLCFSQAFQPYIEHNSIKYSGDNLIFWNEKTKLAWKDFQGEVDSIVLDMYPYAIATIFSEFYYQPQPANKFPSFVIYNAFVKKLSWAGDTLSLNALFHEQLHFDIAELYARKMRKSVQELDKKGIKDKVIYYDLFEKLSQEHDSIQTKFDEETFHGVVEYKQDEWKQKVAIELKKLSDFAFKENNYEK